MVSESCQKNTIITLLFIILACLITFIVMEFTNEGEKPAQCTISNIEYPSSVPTTNLTNYNYNSNHFINCRCGIRCRSELGICTKLYIINNNNGNEILLRNHNVSKDINCTFAEKNCYDGEQIMDRISKVENNAILINNSYRINDTINCVYNMEANAYYVDYYHNEILLFFLIFLSVGIFGCLVFVIAN